MGDNTTMGISTGYKKRINQLAAKETIRCGEMISPRRMLEILIEEKEEEKT